MYICITEVEWETLVATCYYSTNVLNDKNMNGKNKIDLIEIKAKRRLYVSWASEWLRMPQWYDNWSSLQAENSIRMSIVILYVSHFLNSFAVSCDTFNWHSCSISPTAFNFNLTFLSPFNCSFRKRQRVS